PVRERANCVRAEGAAHAWTGSALGVLGRLACLLEAVLLALLHPRVASEETCLLQGRAILRLQIDEGSRDGQAERAGLARHATAPQAGDHVVLPIAIERDQRLPDELLVHLVREIAVHAAAIQGELAGARHEPDS